MARTTQWVAPSKNSTYKRSKTRVQKPEHLAPTWTEVPYPFWSMTSTREKQLRTSVLKMPALSAPSTDNRLQMV